MKCPKELHTIEVDILLTIVRAPKAPTYYELEKQVGLSTTPSDKQKFVHFLDILGFEGRRFICDDFSLSHRDIKTRAYFLTDKGRSYLVENNMI